VRRALALALSLGLLAPAAASAKGGVIFDRYPDVQAVGAKMTFTAMLFEHRDVRPLITFRNAKPGEVVRVRGSRSDLNGISYGAVALPSKGPWATTVSVNGQPIFEGDAEPFRVGVGLTQTIPSADAERTAGARGAASGDGASAWVWVALAATASAVLAFALHRRRRWGAA
jgi:hypothetical protein